MEGWEKEEERRFDFDDEQDYYSAEEDLAAKAGPLADLVAAGDAIGNAELSALLADINLDNLSDANTPAATAAVWIVAGAVEAADAAC